jgi:hypothetical protein
MSDESLARVVGLIFAMVSFVTGWCVAIFIARNPRMEG